MKKCAELIDERALTERKIAQQAQWTRHQLQRVTSRFSDVSILLTDCRYTENSRRSSSVDGSTE